MTKSIRTLQTILLAFLVTSTFSHKVIELNSSNYHSTVRRYKSSSKEALFVKYFAPWCGHCQALAPHWSRNADRLRSWKIPVHLAELDCEEYSRIADEAGVDSMPKLVLYFDGIAYEYKGSTDDFYQLIWAWAKSIVEPDTTCKIHGARDFKGLFYPEGNGFAVGYLGRKEDYLYQRFLDVAQEYRERGIYFFHSFDRAVKDETDGSNIFLFRSFDGGTMTNSGTFTKQKLRKLIRKYSDKVVFSAEDDDSEKVLEDCQTPTALLFQESLDMTSDSVFSLAEVGRDYVSKLNFMVAGNDQDYGYQLSKNFGVTRFPSLKFLHWTGKDFDIISMRTSSLTRENIKKAITQYLRSRTPRRTKAKAVSE